MLKIKEIFALILTIDVLAIVLAITVALSLGYPPTKFMLEGKPITWLSAVQLLMTSIVTAIIFQTRRRQSNRSGMKHSNVYIWLLISLGFLFLCIDEVERIHERLDYLIHSLLNLEETAITDNIDDVIIGFYGLFSLYILYLYRGELKKYDQAASFLKIGFLLMISMIVVDVLSNNEAVLSGDVIQWLGAFEDSLKILAEGVFLGTAFYCLKITQRLWQENRLSQDAVLTRDYQSGYLSEDRR